MKILIIDDIDLTIILIDFKVSSDGYGKLFEGWINSPSKIRK